MNRTPPKRWTPAAAVLLALVSWTASLPAQAKVHVGDTVSFRARLADGPVFTTGDLAGRIVVVHFWLSTHVGSQLQLETLRGILDVYGDEGVVLLGVCLDADRDAARDAIAQNATAPGWYHTLNFTASPPIDARFYDAPYGVPVCWVLGPDGEALWTGHPADLPGVIVGLLESHRPTATGPAPALGRIAPENRVPAQPVAQPQRSAAVKILHDADNARLAEPPVFPAMLSHLAAVPEAVYHDPLVAALVRETQATLEVADAETFAQYEAARDADPAAAQAADALLDAARRTDLEALTADPEVLHRRLDMIRRDQKRERDIAAYDGVMWVVKSAAGNADAGWALRAAATYLADDAFMERYKAHADEKQAQTKLILARGHIAGYQEELAATLLKEILAEYPDSDAAKDAQTLLDSLK